MATTGNAIRNGVDTATLIATRDAVRATPPSPGCTSGRPTAGCPEPHNQSTIHGGHGAKQAVGRDLDPRSMAPPATVLQAPVGTPAVAYRYPARHGSDSAPDAHDRIDSVTITWTAAT
jgi:hypothetical protein